MLTWALLLFSVFLTAYRVFRVPVHACPFRLNQYDEYGCWRWRRSPESGTCTTGDQLESSRDESARQGGVCMHGRPSRKRGVPRGAIVEGEERWDKHGENCANEARR